MVRHIKVRAPGRTHRRVPHSPTGRDGAVRIAPPLRVAREADENLVEVRSAKRRGERKGLCADGSARRRLLQLGGDRGRQIRLGPEGVGAQPLFGHRKDAGCDIEPGGEGYAGPAGAHRRALRVPRMLPVVLLPRLLGRPSRNTDPDVDHGRELLARRPPLRPERRLADQRLDALPVAVLLQPVDVVPRARDRTPRVPERGPSRSRPGPRPAAHARAREHQVEAHARRTVAMATSAVRVVGRAGDRAELAKSHWKGSYNNVVPYAPMTGPRLVAHVLGRIVYVFLMHGWPFLAFEPNKAFVWATAPGVLLSVFFMVNTQINHLTDVCAHASDSANFYKHQVLTAQNFGTDSLFCYYFSGGLNYQIEHHLFPNVNHCHLPELSKGVRRICEKHGIPYHHAAGYGEALLRHVSHTATMEKRPA
ncbi:hypothetical protein ACHAWF_002727 [Thalassiosira exigua]